MTEYPTCDHPELLTKDGHCLLCLELDGQTSIFDVIKHDKNTRN